MPKWADNTNEPQFDISLVIGRFQPPHIGHVGLFRTACAMGRRTLILVGTSTGKDQHSIRTLRDPFTFLERYWVIKELGFPAFVLPLRDHPEDDEMWKAEVNSVVQTHLIAANIKHKPHIVLVGHHKDDSSWYLDMFPEFEYYEHENRHMLSATSIRDEYLRHGYIDASALPRETVDFLVDFRCTAAYDSLHKKASLP